MIPGTTTLQELLFRSNMEQTTIKFRSEDGEWSIQEHGEPMKTFTLTAQQPSTQALPIFADSSKHDFTLLSNINYPAPPEAT